MNRPPPAAKTGDNNYLYLERARDPEGTHDNAYAALHGININYISPVARGAPRCVSYDRLIVS